MSKSRHTEAQMIGALKQVEAGRKVEEVAREVGASKHTLRLESEVRWHGCKRRRKRSVVFLRERKQGAGHNKAGFIEEFPSSLHMSALVRRAHIHLSIRTQERSLENRRSTSKRNF
jgi:hypothetical protein